MQFTAHWKPSKFFLSSNISMKLSSLNKSIMQYVIVHECVEERKTINKNYVLTCALQDAFSTNDVNVHFSPL